MLLEIVLAITAVILLIVAFIPLDGVDLRWKTIRGMAKLPGPIAPPFIGMGLIAAILPDHELLNYLTKISRKYKRLCAAWIVGVPMVLLKEAEDLEVILGSVNHITKGVEYLIIRPWLEDGLLVSTGEKWHKRRKLLTPAFHFKILEDSMQSINKHARYLLRNMLKREGKPFVAEEMVTLCTLDVICETAMGFSLNTQDNKGVEYVRTIKKVSVAAVLRALKFWLRKENIFRISSYGKDYFNGLSLMHKFTEKIIRERKTVYEQENLNLKKENQEEEPFLTKQKKAFLDSLLELDRKYPNLFTDLDIREEVDTFMFEGHDTTSAAIVFALFMLGHNPNIQEKVYQELYSIFGDSDRAATSKDLHEMHYLEMVIKETLRLYPSVPYFSRTLTQDLQLSGDLVIPAGCNIAILPYLIHRDPRYYPNPEVFEPERFTFDNCKNRHPYSYIPFSAGPRNCIGQKFAMMELKVVLSTIIRFVKVDSLTKIEDAVILPFLIIRSKTPIQIKVAPSLLSVNIVNNMYNMSNGEGGTINEHDGHVLEELERLKRDNSYLRMRLTYLEAENNTNTNNPRTAGKTVKLSKWHKVKGALGWEKDKEEMLKVPNSSSDSPFSVSPSSSCLSHSSLGTHYALPVMPHLSSSSSDEELHVQENCASAIEADCKECTLEENEEVQGRNKSLDGETSSKLELHLITNNKKNEKGLKDECQPHHRTPWGKVKCMIHHHSKVGSRKRISCCHQCEKKDEKWQTLSEEGIAEGEEGCIIVKEPTPKLTVTLPSSEEISQERNEKKSERSDTPLNHTELSPPMTRKSKWLKVRDVFLQGSRSAPTSPVRSESFAYDLESDEVSSGEVLGEKEDEVFDDNENLRYEIETSYIELQNRLTEEFTRKMEEIAHNSDIKHRFRLKKAGDNNKSVPQEVIVPTSTGLFRFEGISDKFTRRLYEWEVARGITPEESTFALLDPQYKPLPNKSKNNLVDINNGIVKSKSIGSLVDLGNSNQDVLNHHRTSSLSLNDVEIQASRVQVPEPKEENVEIISDSERNQNSPPFHCTSEETEPRLIDSCNSIVSSECEKETRNNVNCRQVVDSSYQLLQENMSLLDKLKKERDVCRQLEDDMIHLEGQIHNVSKSFEQELVDKIQLQNNVNDINLHSFEYESGFTIDGNQIDLTNRNDQVHQMSPVGISNMDMKLDLYKVENNIFHAEPIRIKYDQFYHHNPNSMTGHRIDSFLIHSTVSELIEMAERLESAVVERDKEIFHLKSELYRKEMAALHGNEIRNYFASFTLPIHRLRSRRSQELSSLPKQIMDKLLELKQALTLVNSASHLNLSTPGNIGQPILSPHILRRCAGHEDLSPEPPVQSRSIASSPASSFSFHDSCNADESPNDWISISAHNKTASHDVTNSSDWLGVRDEHSSFTDLISEDGGSDIGSLMNVSNIFVPTTRKIFSPVGDSKVIEYVIGEECPDNKKKMKETEPIEEVEEEEEIHSDAVDLDGKEEETLETEESMKVENEVTLKEDKNNNDNSTLCQNVVFMECPIENKNVGIQELTLGEELSCSLKMRAMKIQKAKEEFLRGTRTGSLSIVVDSLESDLPNRLLVKSASATAIGGIPQPPCSEELNNIKPNIIETTESQTKSSKSSLLGIFKRPKRKFKEGAIATLARHSLTLSCEPGDSSQTKSCPSSPELSKRSDSSWIKNPAKMIFRPKGKYMINNK